MAIKKVLQDKRFKNRELQIMKQLVKLPHPNIVLLKQCFYSNGEKPEELYLNLVRLLACLHLVPARETRARTTRPAHNTHTDTVP